MRQRSIFSLSVLTVPLCHQAGNATTPAVTKMRLKNVDCKQSPFFSYDRRDQALTFTGGHLGRVSTLGGGGGEGTCENQDGRACSGKRSILMILRKNGNAITDCLNIILGTKSHNLGQFDYLHWPTNYHKRNYRKAKIGHASANRNLSGLHSGKLNKKSSPTFFKLSQLSICREVWFTVLAHRFYYYQQAVILSTKPQ